MSNKIAAYLKPENVRIIDCVKDWREAINVSTHPLVVQGYITDNYSKRVIQLTEEHGSYYIVGKDIALVHARPEDGVIRPQLAITVIHKPVAFFDKPGDPVRLFVTLCAQDSNSHLEMLQELAEILMDEARVQKCAQMTDAAALYQEIVNA